LTGDGDRETSVFLGKLFPSCDENQIMLSLNHLQHHVAESENQIVYHSFISKD
jgi:hypothetical protein